MNVPFYRSLRDKKNARCLKDTRTSLNHDLHTCKYISKSNNGRGIIRYLFLIFRVPQLRFETAGSQDQTIIIKISIHQCDALHIVILLYLSTNKLIQQNPDVAGLR